jgi:hypothetical protein
MAGGAFAQEGKKDDAAAAMQAAKPMAEHAILAKDVGKWKTITKTTMDPTKPPEVSEGTVECEMMINGLFLRSDYHSMGPGGEFHGSSVMGYDAKKKKFTGVWADNWDTSLYPYEGTCDAAGTCTFTMQTADPQGKPMTLTMISKHTDGDHRSFTMQMPGPDGKPYTCMVIDYTRM